MDGFDNVDVQGHDPIMESGAWLRSVSDLAPDTPGCADYLLSPHRGMLGSMSLFLHPSLDTQPGGLVFVSQLMETNNLQDQTVTVRNADNVFILGLLGVFLMTNF